MRALSVLMLEACFTSLQNSDNQQKSESFNFSTLVVSFVIKRYFAFVVQYERHIRGDK